MYAPFAELETVEFPQKLTAVILTITLAPSIKLYGLDYSTTIGIQHLFEFKTIDDEPLQYCKFYKKIPLDYQISMIQLVIGAPLLIGAVQLIYIELPLIDVATVVNWLGT